MQTAFDEGKTSATNLSKNIEGNIKSGKEKENIPRYVDNVKISQYSSINRYTFY